MSVKLIVAYSKKLRVIGDHNTIPWRLPEDMRLFKERTLGHAVIMGRNTWESLKNAPKPLVWLPGRTNFVITSTPAKLAEEFYATLPEDSIIHHRLHFCTMEQMLKTIYLTGKVARDFNEPLLLADYWVIGGEKVYDAFLKAGVVDRIVASEVPGDFAGDAFFPQLPPDDWHPVALASHQGFRVVEFHHRPIQKVA